MSSLATRLDALETDNNLFLVRQCPECGQMVPAPEAIYLAGVAPPCTRGQAHGDIPPPGPRDIVIPRSYAQTQQNLRGPQQ